MKWFITGEPGSGKTTLVTLILEKLKYEGINYDGFITKEIREDNRRTGFQIIDLKTHKRGLLASKKLTIDGPRIGGYVVNLEDIDLIAVRAIERAISESQLIVCDEIGAMELLSENFRRVIERAIRSKKPLLSTLHRKHLNYVNYAQPDQRHLIFLTREKWPEIFNSLSNEIVAYFKNKGKEAHY